VLTSNNDITANRPIEKEEQESPEDYTPLYIYPFYNRLGCMFTESGEYKPIEGSNEDLNMFKPGLTHTYTP
jgi:hypothetical protein